MKAGRVVAFLVLGVVAIWVLAGVVLAFGSFGDLANKVLHRKAGGLTVGVGPQPDLVMTLGDPATSGLREWPKPFNSAPTAYDINGDGAKEIIGHSNDTKVYIFSGTTGRVLKTLETTYPPGWYAENVLNAVEAGVLVPGDAPSIVIANPAAYISAWRFNAEESTPESFAFEPLWEVRAKECFWNPGMDAKPVLGDLNGDGDLEILVQTEERGVFALNPDGTTLWSKCIGGGNSAPIIDDLDGDGAIEAIFASDGGVVTVFDGPTGAVEWTYDATKDGILPASIAVSPTVAELDASSPKEILFTARHAPREAPDKYANYHMAIFAVHQDGDSKNGTKLWMRQPTWAHPLSYTRLVVEDVDRDGQPDIFGMDWNTIGHNPGNWEPLGLAHLFRLDASGKDVWMKEVDSWWSNKDIALLDSRGDGNVDLVANAQLNGGDGLFRYSAESGEPRGFVQAAPWKLARGPVTFAMRNGDDHTFLAVPVTPDEVHPTRGAILIFDLGRPGEEFARTVP